MKVLVSGASGLIGSALVKFLGTWGYQIVRLVRVREQVGKDALYWNPSQGEITPAELEGFYAVVHLAGENIATGRWTENKKRAIRSSRVVGTRLLCEALAQLKQPPKVLISASAVGYYGDCGSEVVDDDSAAGDGFLADVCGEWEAATVVARRNDIRVVNARFGVVFSADGGALARMLLPFRFGFGGVVGGGKQSMSWIAIDDAVHALHHLIAKSELDGAVNLVAPHAVTNRELTKALGAVLHRPTLFPLPAWIARLVLGEMADALLLCSTRALPKRLSADGFTFQYPKVVEALTHLLTRPSTLGRVFKF